MHYADNELPRKQAYLLSRVGSVSSSSSILYLTLDLSSVRTTNSYLCSLKTYRAFSVESCFALINVYLQVTMSGTATNIQLFRREFYAYSYNTLPQNITVKTAFIQAYVNECGDCSLTSDNQIMVKLCQDENCISSLTNTTVTTASTVYARVGLFDPLLLFNYSISTLQIYANGEDITSVSNITMINDGTSPSMQVERNLQDRL